MWEKAKNFWNRVKNTVARAPRTIGAGLNAVTKVVDTTTAWIKDTLDVASNTLHKWKDVVVDSWSKWKWYQKLWNIALSPIIFTWTMLEWAGRTVVTPNTNLLVNGANTIDSTVKDVARPTFRLFSKKDKFTYEDFKTADVIDKKKNRFSWLQFGKKKWVWADAKAAVKSAATAATATAATAVAAWADKIKELKESFDKKLEEMKKWFNDKINELFAKNKELGDKNTALEKENNELRQANDGLAKQVEAQAKQNKELQNAIASLKADVKPADKPVEPKPENKEGKKEEKQTAEKVEKKPEEKKPATEKEEKKPEEKKELERKSEGKKEGVVDVDRIPEIIWGERIKPVSKYIKSNHPNMKISFKNDTTEWHSHLGDPTGEYITVWTANPNIVKMIFVHEFYHVLHYDKINWTRDLLDYVANLSKNSGKQLSTIACEYPEEKRNDESCAEIFGKFLLGDSAFDKYMEFLQSWKNNKLAKISQADADNIKELCKKIISNLNTTSENSVTKTIKMFPDNDNETDVTYRAAA